MQPEEFETRREFNNKFPSQIYVCPKCGKMTINPYVCLKCGWQANGLFDEYSKSYKYIIKQESEQSISIFRPIEFNEQEGENDG